MLRFLGLEAIFDTGILWPPKLKKGCFTEGDITVTMHLCCNETYQDIYIAFLKHRLNILFQDLFHSNHHKSYIFDSLTVLVTFLM